MKDYFGYKDKICVVTGASSGIGKAVCATLIDMGAKVYGLARSKCDIEGMAGFIETDLSSKESIDRAFEQLPDHINCFFGNAGLSGSKTGYWKTFTVDFIANKYITDTYLDKRMEAGDAIVYVTSCGGLMWEKWRREYKGIMKCDGWDEMVAYMKKHFAPRDGAGAMAYTLSKRALNYYAVQKAVEYGKRGIRVNAFLPGSTDTGMKDEFQKMAGGEEALKKENGAVGRLATSQEMAEPVVFLNSEMARFVSGLIFIADWGHNGEKILGYCKNQLDIPAALRIYNTKFFEKILTREN